MRLLQIANSLLAGLALEATATSTSTPSPKYPPSVKIKNGTLSGVHNTAFNQDFFLGVPYATPPIGKHRLRRPEPAQAWNGTKNASTYGPWCVGTPPGIVDLPGFAQASEKFLAKSEDCLQLNIVRPASLLPKYKRLPVLVWFHGGGMASGSGVDERYNGSFLVQESVEMGTPIIYISINYRLATFGFLAGSVIEKAGLTNIGLRDQRQALLWIKENIDAFGGDPNKVTIFGESGGAFAVGLQLIAFGGRGEDLFHGAIMQSGSPPLARTIFNAQGREEEFQKILTATGCSQSQDVLACLQAVPTDVLSRASSSNTQAPVLFTANDDILPELPSRLLDEGRIVKVPVIAGINRNEGTTILALMLSASNATLNTFEDFAAVIADRGFPPAAVRKLWDLYGDEVTNPTEAGLGDVLPSKYGSEFPRVSLFVGDDKFGFTKRYTNQVWDAAGVSSYSYFFDIAPDKAYLDPAIYGVPHVSEIPYVFGNANGVGWEKNPIPQGPDNAANLKMVKLISRMWISFAASGSPNNHKVADVKCEWPVWSSADAKSAWFKLSGLTTQEDNWRQEAMDLNIELTKGREW
ncbi:hypothetical protein GGP41_001474 [Bipolaris sorokiniana]|uniref:Carboxylic ester hydrolase n=1 Tax=Cochliobolus sativus TaxID=45130 RepID=A0A8H5Z9C6_COCSA|nr:hypothetical protein GGP41_001474 [Bipolaris sorokiniana]